MWHKSGANTVQAQEPVPLKTSVSDIRPGQHRIIWDMYKPRGIPESRRILFMRRNDGSLRAWYFHVVHEEPVAPEEDWSMPGKPCEPFDIDAREETILCVVQDRETNRKFILRWSWNGRSFGPLAPDLEPVAGKEENGEFVYGADALDPAFRTRQ